MATTNNGRSSAKPSDNREEEYLGVNIYNNNNSNNTNSSNNITCTNNSSRTSSRGVLARPRTNFPKISLKRTSYNCTTRKSTCLCANQGDSFRHEKWIKLTIDCMGTTSCPLNLLVVDLAERFKPFDWAQAAVPLLTSATGS